MPACVTVVLLSGMRRPHFGVACEILLYRSELSQSPGTTSLPMPLHSPGGFIVDASLLTSDVYALSFDEKSGEPNTPPSLWHCGHCIDINTVLKTFVNVGSIAPPLAPPLPAAALPAIADAPALLELPAAPAEPELAG